MCVRRQYSEMRDIMARPRKQTYTLEMYLNKIKDGDICNDADVQRHFIWTKEQINELVVTVLMDEYIPPIILGEEDSSQLHIADGGQRSSALNRFRYGNYKITSSVENSVIPYKKKIKAEDGVVVWKDTVFDIKNATYEKLPKELQKKFNEYQMDTIIHEHCDRHMISKYIKRYNNHTSMNANQKAFTLINNYAGYIRKIVSSRFFLDYSIFTETEKKKGVTERVVVETVMCCSYFRDWKKQCKAACKYLNSNADKEDFKRLEDNLHRLEHIITDEIKDIFNSRDSFLFLTLFERFTTLGLEDSEFARFLSEFKHHLRHTQKNEEGMLFDEIGKEKSTKDKVVIAAKLDMLEALMKQFLRIPKEDEDRHMDESLFISEMVGIDRDMVKEDMDLYEETLDDLVIKTFRNESKLLDKENRVSLLAMVAYSYKEDKDLDKWLPHYARRKKRYLADQKENFLKMKQDFEELYRNPCQVEKNVLK